MLELTNGLEQIFINFFPGFLWKIQVFIVPLATSNLDLVIHWIISMSVHHQPPSNLPNCPDILFVCPLPFPFEDTKLETDNVSSGSVSCESGYWKFEK